METIERLESAVRSYCRRFPTVFARAEGAYLVDADGRRYLDFLCGAGALNYGHAHPLLVAAAHAYLASGGPIHALDLATPAKIRFLERFEEVVLAPRDLEYRVQFPGPTGTNAVEAALKLARKVTGRSHVVTFSNAFHGMTLGALAMTEDGAHRRAAGVELNDTLRAPFGESLASRLQQGEEPAAIVLETVQAEGGIHVASAEWLRETAALARQHGALLIVDEIQTGCGRTGPFFSFERAGIRPDIVCVAKSISGLGLPMALVLIAPEHDVWTPGEHNGTLRGHNLAFATATAALDLWTDDELPRETERKGARVAERLRSLATAHGLEQPVPDQPVPDQPVPDQPGLGQRGLGLIHGLELTSGDAARRVSQSCFERGLVVETCGADGEVLKLLPPLTIADDELDAGLNIIEAAVAAEADA